MEEAAQAAVQLVDMADDRECPCGGRELRGSRVGHFLNIHHFRSSSPWLRVLVASTKKLFSFLNSLTASLAIIQYDPARAIANRRPRNDLRVKPITISDSTTILERDGKGSSDGDHCDSVRAGQSRNQTYAQKSENDDALSFVGGSREFSNAENVRNELDSLFDETDGVVGTENGFVTKAGSAFAKASAECEAEVQDSDAEFRANNGMGDNHHLSRYNPLVAPDDESDSESEDDLVWKKRRVDQVPWLRTADETDNETDNETDDTKFGISCTRVRADDARPEADGIASQIEDFVSTSTGPVEPQPVIRVGGNGEWGIYGIIGKEVINGVLHYCVDWESTMLPTDVLRGGGRMVQEFETKEQARSGKRGHSRKRKRAGRGKQRF
ncbi:MAG: hypothetical protein M1839_008276 [Geoglossum umbratile]|nr:MAG: hypothetical protein M1839_008276 [Geoglossum umbratile]